MNENENMFPQVREIKPVTYPDHYIQSAEWFQFQYPLLKRYFTKVLEGFSVCDFFQGAEVSNVAVYALTEFAELAIKDIDRSCVSAQIGCISDRNYDRFQEGFLGHAVSSPEAMLEQYRNGTIDKIIVCSIFHANEIMSDLMKMGFQLKDLITISDIILQ